MTDLKDKSIPSYEPDQIDSGDGKIVKHFDHCFEIAKIEDGDYLPVGGENCFSDETNIKAHVNVGDFDKFLTGVHKLVDECNLWEFKRWLDSYKIEIDEKLFSILFVFTREFEKNYPSKRAEKTRKELYTDGYVALGDICSIGVHECAEIAAVAQMCLQREGISSTYFSGEVLWNKDIESSEPHSFIIIRDKGKVYIYDPANPIYSQAGESFPAIYTTKTDFDKEMAKKEKRLVTAKRMIVNKEAFYGVGDGTNILIKKHIA